MAVAVCVCACRRCLLSLSMSMSLCLCVHADDVYCLCFCLRRCVCMHANDVCALSLPRPHTLAITLSRSRARALSRYLSHIGVHARASSLSFFLPSSLSLLPCCKHAGGRSPKNKKSGSVTIASSLSIKMGGGTMRLPRAGSLQLNTTKR